MALTQLDPTCALILIDLQQGIVSMPTVHPMQGIIGRAAELARAFRERGLPVVLVNVTERAPGRTENSSPLRGFPAGWDTLVPELGQHPKDLHVSKKRPGAFIGTALDSLLREQGVTQVVFGGVSTSNGVEASARSAFDLGYNITFAVDAMTDLVMEMHQHSVGKVFPKIGEVGTSADVLRLLGTIGTAPKPD